MNWVFGYGSLVNDATHGHADLCPMRLEGWRRRWQHSRLRQVAFLSAEPAPGAQILGLAARVAPQDWEALDQRERAYDRLPLPEHALTPHEPAQGARGPSEQRPSRRGALPPGAERGRQSGSMDPRGAEQTAGDGPAERDRRPPIGRVHLYRARAEHVGPPTLRHPVLLSYLDVVVQGYRRWFGEDGVAAFFASTDGWDAPILNDRAAPRYPRHQPLSKDDREMVDHHLLCIGARVIEG